MDGHPKQLRDVLRGILPDCRLVATPDFHKVTLDMAYKGRTVRCALWVPDPDVSESLLPALNDAARAWFAETNDPPITNPRIIDGLGCEWECEGPVLSQAKKRRKEPEPEPEPAPLEPSGELREGLSSSPHTCMFCTGCELYQCESYHGADGSWPCEYCDAVWNHFANCV